MPAWLRDNALEECGEGMLRRRGSLQQTGCFCSVSNQNQACTEAENRALEGRSGVLPLSFSIEWAKWLGDQASMVRSIDHLDCLHEDQRHATTGRNMN